jgi:two-component system LytT family response regulator
MNILIVDDEPPSRRGVREALKEIGIKEGIREAASIDQALKEIKHERPDVILLDIEMRGGVMGFDLLEKLPAEGIPVVFVTAYEQHAVRAFSVKAHDYLLKPVDPKRLKETLAVIQEKTLRENPPLGPEDKILLPDGSKYHYVRVGDIQILESNDSYTKVIRQDGNNMINGSLKSVLDRLDPDLFFSTTRKTAVNLREITAVSENEAGNIVLEIGEHTPIELSRRRSVLFRKKRGI